MKIERGQRFKRSVVSEVKGEKRGAVCQVVAEASRRGYTRRQEIARLWEEKVESRGPIKTSRIPFFLPSSGAISFITIFTIDSVLFLSPPPREPLQIFLVQRQPR